MVLEAGMWIIQQFLALAPAGLCWSPREVRLRGQLSLSLNLAPLLIINGIMDSLLLLTLGPMQKLTQG